MKTTTTYVPGADTLDVTNDHIMWRDSSGKIVRYENSDGYWETYTYDANGKIVLSYKNSDGYWETYDANGHLVASGNVNTDAKPNVVTVVIDGKEYTGVVKEAK